MIFPCDSPILPLLLLHNRGNVIRVKKVLNINIKIESGEAVVKSLKEYKILKTFVPDIVLPKKKINGLILWHSALSR